MLQLHQVAALNNRFSNLGLKLEPCYLEEQDRSSRTSECQEPEEAQREVNFENPRPIK